MQMASTQSTNARQIFTGQCTCLIACLESTKTIPCQLCIFLVGSWQTSTQPDWIDTETLHISPFMQSHIGAGYAPQHRKGRFKLSPVEIDQRVCSNPVACQLNLWHFPCCPWNSKSRASGLGSTVTINKTTLHKHPHD